MILRMSHTKWTRVNSDELIVPPPMELHPPARSNPTQSAAVREKALDHPRHRARRSRRPRDRRQRLRRQDASSASHPRLLGSHERPRSSQHQARRRRSRHCPDAPVVINLKNPNGDLNPATLTSASVVLIRTPINCPRPSNGPSRTTAPSSPSPPQLRFARKRSTRFSSPTLSRTSSTSPCALTKSPSPPPANPIHPCAS